MINKFQRMKIMSLLSSFYQNESENVSQDTKKAISVALLASDNIALEEEILKLCPKTNIGRSFKMNILKLLIEEDPS